MVDNATRVSATRQRLIEATIALLVERGYYRTTFVEVASRAGMSRGAVHHHFDSLPGLMVSVVQRIRDDIRDSVLAGIASTPDLTSDLTAAVDFVWEQLNSDKFRAYHELRSAVATDEALREAIGPVLKSTMAGWMKIASEFDENRIDPYMHRIVLAALTGAALADQTLGPSLDDPDRTKFRTSLKRIISRDITTQQ